MIDSGKEIEKMAGRIFVIGIDGGDYSLINTWLKEGRLPNLAKLKAKGSFGKLRSTIPPITGAAWSSFQTGTNPGKHGAFNWFKRVKGEYRARPVYSADIAEPSLWKILSKLEKKVGIIGVPVTYPPSRVNGFIIPGLLTPSKAKTKSFPENLIERVRELAPDFKFSPKEWTRGYKPVQWVKELINDVGVKVKVTTHLMGEKTWDFMMVHFMETDQVQHFMWNYMNGRDDWNPVLQVYEAVDSAIGKITEHLDKNDSIIIMSDHGFGPLKYNFHIDTWLLKEGYIKLRKNLWTKVKEFLFKKGFTKEALYPVGEYFYPLLRRWGLLETVLDLVGNPFLNSLFLSSSNVDWSKTRAYSHSEIGHIYLNIKGREPQGIIDPVDRERVRDELIDKLRELKNPFTGEIITSKVYKSEEIYHGDRVKGAPDIVFLPDNMEILGKGAYEFLSNRIVSPSRSQSGHHRMNGLFFATGPDIKSNYEVKDAHIMDIAPTVLYKLGLPVLDYMDGKILDDIFVEGYLEEHKVSHISKEDLNLNSDNNDDDIEEEEMKKRLKGLGYVS